jgi:hypothetical protein
VVVVILGLMGVLALAAAPAFAAPPETPETGSATEVKAESARLNGVLNPGTLLEPPQSGFYEFLYKASTKVGCVGESKAPPSPGLMLGVGPEPVSEPVLGLKPGTGYAVCLRAENGAKEAAVGLPVTFTTVPVPFTDAPSPIGSTAVALKGHFTLNESAATQYSFIYKAGTECIGGSATPIEEAGKGPGTVAPETAPVTGLVPHTQYTVCFVTSNAFGFEQGPPVTFTTLAAAPTIEGAFVTDVSSTSATLHANLNPQGAPTSYTFEYALAGGEFKPVSEPGSEGVLPEGTSGVPLEVHVQHRLEPNRAYAFRLTASNPVKTVTSEPVSFTTQAGGEFVLPDGRQYEMVSPAQKQGALFLPLFEPPERFAEGSGQMVQGSVRGDAIVSTATGPTEAEPPGYSDTKMSVLSTRGRSGWSSQVIAPPHPNAGPSGQQGEEYRYFSRDLSLGVLQPLGDFAKLSPQATESTAYLRTDYFNGNVAEHCEAPYTTPASCFLPLVTAANDTASPFQRFGEVNAAGECGSTGLLCGPFFEAGTPDLSHVVLSSPMRLTSTPVEPPPVGTPLPNLYEWAGGQLQLLSLMPGAHEGSRHFALAGGNNTNSNYGGVASRHSISNDGRYIVMEESESIHGAATGMFLRDVARGETIRLDVPQGAGTEVSVEPEYMTASSSGSRIFFFDAARLTSDSGSVAKRPDLYECAIAEEPGTGKDKCTLTDLTPKAGEPACVVMVLGAGEDGSYVYFTAGGVLAPGAVGDPGCSRTPGQPPEAQARNMYVRHEGVTRLVARLSEEDSGDWLREGHGLERPGVRVSPSGRWLAFMSGRSLTGYDTRDAVSGRPDQEVYVYDAVSGGLACASCDPTGARPRGLVSSGTSHGVAALVPGWTKVQESGFGEAFYQSRYLSDSGRLFFDSRGALVPSDVNGTWDVYQYEPEGVPAGPHACSSSIASGSEVFKPVRVFEVEGRGSEEGAGCVALISSGTSAQESTFLDASEAGGDVFFLTNAKLSRQDTDTAPDVYDAHECTASSPCISPPVPLPPPCNTESACRAAPPPQPGVFGAPSSETFSGPGNLAPPPPPSKAKGAAQIRAEQLGRALRACKRKVRHVNRKKCEKEARARYGPVRKKVVRKK